MAAPLTHEKLINEITDRHGKMSKRFQQIARYLVQNPNEVALDSVKTIAQSAGVQPSSLVRFAQSFDFDGFSDLQKIFQLRLLTAAPGFNERINALQKELGRRADTTNLAFLRDLVIRDTAALQDMLDTVSEDQLAQAVELLHGASRTYVIGQLRSYPVANFLRYVLTMLRREVMLLDAAGGLASEQAQLIGDDGVLVAISFRHYAREVVDVVEEVGKRGVPIIAITDNQLSPIAKRATLCFCIPEDDYSFSRSLAAPMCLAQTLLIGLAHRLQPDMRGRPVIPVATKP
jgi:DNA-binding MurR/RpiR family transcriptional regulator